ncbi:hypothetical protein KO498_13140 [Lentibacter algarum]|uniref:hypothetical protein n=1 Tax=Lentibacter algarum TaxID=576131 RepID=UPI001C09DB2E|nr:hypothetical protein [Lentibacter algarum]MBU2982755.1 hypothetical protein [Lentibacter algarum]
MTAQQDRLKLLYSHNSKLARIKRATPLALEKLLFEADWQQVPLPVLEWATSRKGVRLTAALQSFINADPMRFNYLHKNEVPQEFRAMCRLLDALCLRINSGFFDSEHPLKLADRPVGFDNWLSCQQLDKAAGKVGRWVIRERVLTVPASRPPVLPFAELTSPVPNRMKICADWRQELRKVAKQRFQTLAGGDLNQA